MSYPTLDDYKFADDGHKNGRHLVKRHPVYIRKLCAAMNSQQEVADLLDCARATISRAITENTVTGIYEVAAKAIYQNKFGQGGGQSFVVLVPNVAMDDFKAAMGLVSNVRIMQIPKVKS